MTKRYFIMFFQGDSNGEPVVGDIPGTTENGEYINRKDICTAIESAFNCKNVTFTNIIELSKEDYIQYNND